MNDDSILRMIHDHHQSYHDIIQMSITHSQYVGDHAVACTALDEGVQCSKGGDDDDGDGSDDNDDDKDDDDDDNHATS